MVNRQDGFGTFKKLSNLKVQIKPVVKNIIATTLVFSSLSLATLSTTNAQNKNLDTVYHVYINNSYIGTATNKEVVETIVDKKIETMQEKYGEYDYVLASDITYIQEQVFRNTSHNAALISSLEEQLTVEVDSAAITIDGKEVAFLENEQSAEEVIKQLKLAHVSEEELQSVEKLKENNEKLPPLKKDETRLLDITLSKEMSVVDNTVTDVENILNVKDAVKLLQKGTLEEKKYEVKSGDVLGTIAADHGLKLKQLLELNPKITEKTVLQIGQALNVTVYEPYVDVLVTKEHHVEEKINFKKEVEEDKTMFKGDTKVKQKGKKGLKEVTYSITEKNGKVAEKEVIEEEVVKKPVTEITLKGTKVVPSRGSGSLAWPTNGGYVSSGQGYRWNSLHKGIDIARPSNLTIKAADNGTVVSAGWNGGYGNKIVINHNNGYQTVYAHLSSIGVSPGQTVSKGQSIGVMGTTGNSTGVHLHFEVYINGALKNPLNYLK